MLINIYPKNNYNMDVINLSDYILSTEERTLLLKGLSFCLDSNLDAFEAIKDLNLFARKLLFQSLYSKNRDKQSITTSQHKDLDDLLTLLEEQDPFRPNRCHRSRGTIAGTGHCRHTTSPGKQTEE